MPSETPEGRDSDQEGRRQFERLQFELYRADRAGRDFIQQDRVRRDRAALDALPPPPRPPAPKIEVSEQVLEPIRRGTEVVSSGPPPTSSPGVPPYLLTEVLVCDMTDPDTPTSRTATFFELAT